MLNTLFLRSFRCLPAVAGVMMLAGCGTLENQTTGDAALPALTFENTGDFGPRPAIPSPDDIHALTDQQTDDFLRYMNDPAMADTKANMRMASYIEKLVEHFSYEGRTFNASETIKLESGNCMSLAVLTTALADLAGLEIDYQLMDDVPVYELNGTLVKKGLHIRTIINEPDVIEIKGAYLLSRPGVQIDFFPTQRQRFVSNIDRNDYLAMYYQNMAVESLEREQLNEAYWYAWEALARVPEYTPALNTLAVLNRKVGNLETAERIYQYGIAHADEKLTLLKNYLILLKSEGRDEDAANIQSRLNRMEDPSPFHWFQLAREYYNAGDYRAAIGYYRRALSLAPYLHEAWFGIAQANYEMGRMLQTRNALEEALEQAEKVSTKNLYQAKLVALARETGR